VGRNKRKRIAPLTKGGAIKRLRPTNRQLSETARPPCALFLFTRRAKKRRKSANPEGTSAAMRWFRSRRLAITLVALFALASQFAHTFGHVHLDRFADSALIAWGKAPAATNLAGADQPPSQDRHAPIRLVDGFCAICASISLAGTALIPTSPVVVARESPASELQWLYMRVAAPSAGHFHFDARGPPSA
jgi:peptidoglycan/LPS O-acetylase OafA/YrhL